MIGMFFAAMPESGQPKCRLLRYRIQPRFEDGSVNLRELMRRIAEDVVNAIMDADADQLYAGGANSRNGYRERNLVTFAGENTIHTTWRHSNSLFSG